MEEAFLLPQELPGCNTEGRRVGLHDQSDLYLRHIAIKSLK